MIKLISSLFKKFFSSQVSEKDDPGNHDNKETEPDVPPKPYVEGHTPPKKRSSERQQPSREKKPKWTPDQFQVPEKDGQVRFHDLNLPLPLMHAIADLKFEYAMPVQAEVIPCTLTGQDATARAQTGTGKSAAFLITIITRLMENPLKEKRPRGTPRALILAPTRELVLQIEKDAKALAKYTNIYIISLYGGMGYQKQQDQLSKRPVDIIAATPGRLMDFTQKKRVNPGRVEILVIDEADRMLDMGFIPDIRRIIYSTPHKDKRQTLFFSATLAPEILRIASQWTKNPAGIEIDPCHKASESIKQKVYLSTEEEKFILLYNLVTQKNLSRVILFVNRRDTTDRLAKKLNRYRIKSGALSGAVSQVNRIKTLDAFKKGKIRILVATDVAARGLHIEGVSHVVNYDLPQDPEHYIHRIGRTGRAGAEGISISFADENSSFYIPDIENVLGNTLECEYPDKTLLTPLPQPEKKAYTNPPKKYPPKFKKKQPLQKNRNISNQKPVLEKKNRPEHK